MDELFFFEEEYQDGEKFVEDSKMIHGMNTAESLHPARGLLEGHARRLVEVTAIDRSEEECTSSVDATGHPWQEVLIEGRYIAEEIERFHLIQ